MNLSILYLMMSRNYKISLWNKNKYSFIYLPFHLEYWNLISWNFQKVWYFPRTLKDWRMNLKGRKTILKYWKSWNSRSFCREITKKIRIMILFVGIFALMGNNKLGVMFVILFTNFKVCGKNPTFGRSIILGVNIPFHFGITIQTFLSRFQILFHNNLLHYQPQFVQI